MLVIPASPLRVRNGKNRQPAPPPPRALTLVAAAFSPSGSIWVRLTFDRAVAINAISVGAIVVDDNVDTDHLFSGTGTATLVDARTVQIPLVMTGSAHGGSFTLLTAAAGNGIIAVDDEGAWTGATAVAIPFG